MSEPGASLADWVMRRFEPPAREVSLDAGAEVRLSAAPVRIALAQGGFRLSMGEQSLDFHPDPLLVVDDSAAERAVVVVCDPSTDGLRALANLRLAAGEELRLDPQERAQHGLYTAPDEVRRRRPLLRHEGDALVLRVAVDEPPSVVSALPLEARGLGLLAARRRALATLVELYGPRFEPHSPQQALTTLLEVNRAILADADYQPRDARGEPGALLELPETVAPILVGDIHGRIDNLLSVLTRNGLLAAVESGEAALVFLGDLVHHDDPGQLEQMDSSMLVMDLVFCLMLRYPRRVFMLLGNHDAFSPEVMKHGVPQGLLWEKAVRAARGDAYRDALARFYAIAPLVMRAAHSAACHAGPPKLAVTRQSLVDAHGNPALAHELTWTRCAGPGVTNGYRASEVRQLRRALGLPRHADLVVGHYPRSENATVWMDSDGIGGHHVLFSARDRVVGVMPSIDGRLVPQVYPVEPVSSAGGDLLAASATGS